MEWIARRLSPWTAWKLRNQISGSRFPGVYLLAHLETIPDFADPLDRRIIYIGETHSANADLKWRWREFNRCAFGVKDGGHSGGNTYRSKFGGTPNANLHVSALAVALEQPWYSAFILAAERLLI
jgi:hypothetical protein